MKKVKYIVEIEMPDGDYIGPEWLKDDLQDVLDGSEDSGRNKVVNVSIFNPDQGKVLLNLLNEFNDEEERCLVKIGFCKKNGMKLEEEALRYEQDAISRCWLKLQRAIQEIDSYKNANDALNLVQLKIKG